MTGSCNVNKETMQNWQPFRLIMLAFNTPTYKLAKFLVPILKPLTSNKFTMKDSFYFAEEIVDVQPDG